MKRSDHNGGSVRSRPTQAAAPIPTQDRAGRGAARRRLRPRPAVALSDRDGSDPRAATSSRPPWPPAERFFPGTHTLPSFRKAASRCRACDLYQRATQTVFGEGGRNASVILVGEQPGDVEDRSGHPFVGPAGRMLRASLDEVGLPLACVYLTNAVKHFRWVAKGNRRVHKPPNLAQINACLPWLIEEIDLVKPTLVVCLGATAARALLGPDFRLTKNRGRVHRTAHAPWVLATLHPSAIVRMPDRSKREEARRSFLADLRKVASALREA